MSQELLYTSAPEGLNSNDQGFCTVACTEGMPRNLKELLENLTAYRQADQPPHPVNFSHLIHTVGGKRYQILSRVSDYEKDYSGRTNKLAHHVALRIEELPAGGPAALLGTSLFRTHWDGHTRWIPQGPSLPAVEAYRGTCRRWEALTGDAGWAGVLAESAADDSNRPMYVIFPAGEDMLPLVSEALGILPPEKAWTTSFSTYFTKLPAGVDCLWRFVLDGSPEAEQARSASHGRVIDLVELQQSRRQAPHDNPYVEAARAGRPVQSQATSAPATFAPSASAESVDASPMPTSGYELKPAEPARPPSPFPSQSKAPASPFGPRKKRAKRSSKLPLVLGGVAVALCIGVGTLVYSMFSRDIPPSLPEAEPIANKRNTRSDQQKTDKPFRSPTEPDEQEAAQKTEDESDPKKPEVEPDKVVKNAPLPPEPKKEKTTPWDQSLVKLDGKLPLPERNQTAYLANTNSNKKAKTLAEIHVENPNEVDLTILSPVGSSKEIAEAGSGLEGFIIESPDNPDADDMAQRWVVKRKWFLPPPLNHTQQAKEVGTFELADEKLKFKWNWEGNVDAAKPNSLQYCLLEISKGDEKHRFQLSEPKKAEPLALKTNEEGTYNPRAGARLDVNRNAIDDPSKLRLDLLLEGIEGETFSKKGMKPGDHARFATKNSKLRHGDPNIEFEITFEIDEKKDPQIVLNTIATRKEIKPLTTNEANQKLHKVSIETLREPTIAAYFSRYKKLAEDNLVKIKKSPIYNEANAKRPMLESELANLKTQLANLKSELASLQSRLKKENDGEEKKKLKEKITTHEQKIESREQKITKIENSDELQTVKRYDVTNEILRWCNEMEPYFEKLEKSAQIGYTVYTEIQGGRIDLTRTRSEEKPANNKSK